MTDWPDVQADPGPGAVWDLIHGLTTYWAVSAALDLGVLAALDPGLAPATRSLPDAAPHQSRRALSAGAVSAAIMSADVDATEVLLDTLVAIGVLECADTERDGVGYRLAPLAQRYLRVGAPGSMAALVQLSPGPQTAWPALAHTIRTGHPAVSVADEPTQFYPALVAATAPIQQRVADALAHHLDGLGRAGAAMVVDFGAGCGAWISALLNAWPDTEAVAVDLPGIAELAADYMPAEVAGRVKIVAGDYLDAPLPVTTADVVILAHVLRAEPPERARALVERAVSLIGEDGVVLIADYTRPGPPGPGDSAAARGEALRAARHDLLLGLTMVAATPGGRGVTELQLDEWLGGAGAAVDEVLEPVPRQKVYVARRRPEQANRRIT